MKQQEQLQNEMIDEIKVKSETLLKSKQELYQKYVTLVDRQGDLQSKYVLKRRINKPVYIRMSFFY